MVGVCHLSRLLPQVVHKVYGGGIWIYVPWNIVLTLNLVFFSSQVMWEFYFEELCCTGSPSSSSVMSLLSKLPCRQVRWCRCDDFGPHIVACGEDNKGEFLNWWNTHTHVYLHNTTVSHIVWVVGFDNVTGRWFLAVSNRLDVLAFKCCTIKIIYVLVDPFIDSDLHTHELFASSFHFSASKHHPGSRQNTRQLWGEDANHTTSARPIETTFSDSVIYHSNCQF